MDEGVLGKRLKELREKRGYYQKFVADKLGIKSNTLSGYENGTRMPDPTMLSHLADLYDVSVDYLLGRSTSEGVDLNVTKISYADTSNQSHVIQSSSRANRDIAKRLEKLKQELEQSDGLAFDGEPMSEEAKESLLESMELLFRQTQRINKKFTPKKYREDE